MFQRFGILSMIFRYTNSALFGAYSDSACTQLITTTVAFTDVCTWTSNRYSGSWSVYLNSCNDSALNAVVFNASDSPTCQGTPYLTLPVTSNCNKFIDFYLKGFDFSCDSENTTYNIIAHFDSMCKDGGIPFSIQLGQPSCQGDSFAPGFFDLDTQGSYSDPYYRMEVFNTTNGICKDKLATYETQSFPAQCISSQNPFNNILLDIYQAFPAPI